MKNIFTCAFICFLCTQLSAAAPISLELVFDWSEQTQKIVAGSESLQRLHFKGAFYPEEQPLLPMIIREVPLQNGVRPVVEIEEVEYLDRKWPTPEGLEVPGQLGFNWGIEKDRGRYFGKLALVPLIKEGNTIKLVRRIRLKITQRTQVNIQSRSSNFVTNSALREGSIYKVSVTEAGIYKMDYNFLRNDLGIDIDNVNAANIQVYTNQGGAAPELPGPDNPDDLQELNIWIKGGEDGRINNGDYLLFYTEGPDRWFFDSDSENFEFEKNVYDDEHFIFLKIGGQNGRRVNTTTTPANTVVEFSTFDDFIRLEEDKVNLHHFWGETLGKAQGSGKNWYGDHFKNLRTYSYDDQFRFPGIRSDESIRVRARMALRAEQRSSFELTVNGQLLTSSLASRVGALSGPNDNINNFANAASIEELINVNEENLNITVDYPYPQGNGDGSEAWLDYIQINAKRSLDMIGSQMDFRVIASSNFDLVAYRIGNLDANHMIWDVTDPFLPMDLEVQLSGSEGLVRTNNQARTIQEMIIFNPDQISQMPTAIGEIPNQNLHGIEQTDMVIVTTEALQAQAEELAAHRSAFSELDVSVILVEQIYNEFSSGRKEPAAIRDFARMLYTRDPNFRYLLLFGDGSFDHKDIYELGFNLIPTFQQDSFNPLYAFPADDFYGILEPGQSAPLRGRLNVSVGRIPARDEQEAQVAVNKIKLYDSNPSAFQDWRNRLVFVADDEDGNTHIRDADEIAEEVGDAFRAFNLDKIYLDAYPQVSTPGGNRFPRVNEALNQAIFKGTLVVTYLGHGGEQGWAQERILNIPEILSWSNINEMPLLMTATCSFTGYDDPTFTSAGEETFLNPKGGAFALMTTTRAVFANQNAALTEIALEKLFSEVEGRLPTLGEAMQLAKNVFTSNNISTNSRKFTLIGDPAQKLAIPEYQVITNGVDEAVVTEQRLDTLSALQKVKIKGFIADNNGNELDDFNGIIFPTVFDKEVTLKTLGQDQGSRVQDFDIQKNIIFKGRASVVNGQFEFDFIIPKDINYSFGPGKISYYASDASKRIDANGSFEQIIIGGSNAANIADTQGPRVDVFMNTEDFVFGGITDPNPTLLVKLEDEFGINVVGNSIGHDLEAVLDDDTQNTLLLNDFFQSELDDFTRGEVRFPLNGLSEGLHTLRVKAWDVANNSAEGYTEFLVAESEEMILEHVLNYPNPFTDRTCFQFDHNNAGQELDVQIQIFTVSGRLVKTLEANIFSDGAIRQDDCIEWDGRDDFGDPLAKGVYLYKVRVRANVPGIDPIRGESEFQKLVLLK